jgi:hypothetical protein
MSFKSILSLFLLTLTLQHQHQHTQAAPVTITDPQCTTHQPGPKNGILEAGVCPSFMTSAEISRGIGAYYDNKCLNRAGSWSAYGEYKMPGYTKSCCRTCIWSRQNTMFSYLPSTELPNCPPCVKTYYENQYGSAAALQGQLISPTGVVNNIDKCPGKTGNSNVWLYNEGTNKCYYKSSFQYGIATSAADAAKRCTSLHPEAQLVKVQSQAENDFVLLNMLWVGIKAYICSIVYYNATMHALLICTIL